MQSDFKNINVVPIGNEFVNLILSRKGLNINSLCQDYTHKVKKTKLRFLDKLSTILDDFPRLDQIHPFFTDFLRLVFDRDRYKFALGQVDTARHLVTNIANDYVKLVLLRAKTIEAVQILKSFVHHIKILRIGSLFLMETFNNV